MRTSIDTRCPASTGITDGYLMRDDRGFAFYWTTGSIDPVTGRAVWYMRRLLGIGTERARISTGCLMGRDWRAQGMRDYRDRAGSHFEPRPGRPSDLSAWARARAIVAAWDATAASFVAHD